MNKNEVDNHGESLYERCHIRNWLPSRGNVLFTLLMVATLLIANRAGALTLAAPAASTTTIPYQGRLTDTGGNPLTGTYAMTFRLYAAASGGAALWTETWTGGTGVRVNAGLFNVMLGSYTPIPQSVVTANSTLWLGITVGADAEMLPRVQLGSVPFAMQALTVPDGSIGTANLANNVITTTKIIDKAVTPAKLDRPYLPLTGGNVTNLWVGISGEGSGGQLGLSNGQTGDFWMLDNFFGAVRFWNSGGVKFTLDSSGNTWSSGTKSAIVHTENYGTRKLYAVESAGVRLTDEGIADMVDGTAYVSLDPIFIETVEGEFVITVTPYGDASVYVSDIGSGHFTVLSRDSGTNVRFAWRVSAYRKGFANVRLEPVVVP